MFSRFRLSFKYFIIFLLTVLLVVMAMFASLHHFRSQVLRNEAQAVAAQVVSFRAWVANAGMVWVNGLSKDFHDFLAKRSDATGNHFFGKNPALATRELSEIANQSAIRATFRVTSDEYRQSANAPDDFESRAIRAFKVDREIHYFEDYENGHYRYAQPIYVQEACLKCHGRPEEAPAEVLEKYGSERAFGYKVGDVRGIISVQLPDLALAEVAQTLLNPITLGLLLLAFVINLTFTQFSLIQRLKRLTAATKAIADGQLETELQFGDVKRSRDEVDHVANAIHQLRNSLRLAMRRIKR